MDRQRGVHARGLVAGQRAVERVAAGGQGPGDVGDGARRGGRDREGVGAAGLRAQVQVVGVLARLTSWTMTAPAATAGRESVIDHSRVVAWTRAARGRGGIRHGVGRPTASGRSRSRARPPPPARSSSSSSTVARTPTTCTCARSPAGSSALSMPAAASGGIADVSGTLPAGRYTLSRCRPRGRGHAHHADGAIAAAKGQRGRRHHAPPPV